MLTELVEDLLHLEGGGVGLHQAGGPDGAARDAQEVLGQVEGVVPEPCLEVVLHLRQVEVGALAGVDLQLGARRHVEGEVDQPAGHPLAVDGDVLLVEVPPPGAHDDRRQLALVGGAQGILLALGGGEGDGPRDRVAEVDLPLDDVLPQGRVGVLLVGQPHAGAGVHRVDRHLAVGGARHLHPAVDQSGRGVRDPPGVVLADARGRGQEVEVLAVGDGLHDLRAGGEPLLAARLQVPVEDRDELESAGGEDLLVAGLQGSGHLDAVGKLEGGGCGLLGHGAPFRLPHRGISEPYRATHHRGSGAVPGG